MSNRKKEKERTMDAQGTTTMATASEGAAVAEPPEMPAETAPEVAPVTEETETRLEPPADPLVPSAPEDLSPAMLEIESLRAKIAELKAARATRRVASGSKPRPNVTYVLLAKPPQWHGTPQVAQLQQILFDPAFVAAHTVEVDGKPVVRVAEPDLFAQVVAGHAAGVLRTRQEPVRIFQYYRSDLLHADCLRWS